MDSLLTSGSLAKIMSGVRISPSFTPIMQIIGLKEMSTHGSRRFRILISDGVHSLSTGMLGPELTGLVDGQQLTVNTVVKVNACNIPNALAEKAGKPIVIFTDVSVIKEGSEVGKRLGNPQVYRAEAATTGVSANTGPECITSNVPPPGPASKSWKRKATVTLPLGGEVDRALLKNLFSQTEDDDCLLFLRSLAPKIRKIPAESQLEAQMEIMQVINKYLLQSCPQSQLTPLSQEN